MHVDLDFDFFDHDGTTDTLVRSSARRDNVEAWISVAKPKPTIVFGVFTSNHLSSGPKGLERLYLVRVDEDDLRLGLDAFLAGISSGGYRFRVHGLEYGEYF